MQVVPITEERINKSIRFSAMYEVMQILHLADYITNIIRMLKNKKRPLSDFSKLPKLGA